MHNNDSGPSQLPAVPNIDNLMDAIDIWIDSLIEDECKRTLEAEAKALADYLSTMRTLTPTKPH